jgi:hypothetical protein
MKIIVFALIALGLPYVSRFQEMKVFRNGKVIFEQDIYGQKSAAPLLVITALALFGAAWKERQRFGQDPKSRMVRFAPAVFALPCAWQQWVVSQYGGGDFYTEIKSGLGGPMTDLFVSAAALFFIAADTYWRQRQPPNQSLPPTGLLAVADL